MTQKVEAFAGWKQEFNLPGSWKPAYISRPMMLLHWKIARHTQFESWKNQPNEGKVPSNYRALPARCQYLQRSGD